MLPIHKQVYNATTTSISKEAKLDILPVARWFGEETFTYTRVFGRIASPHFLPYYLPGMLMAREIAYQLAREVGMIKLLKEWKKDIWPTFPLQSGAFSLHDFGHACKEAEIMKSIKLATFLGRQYNPNGTVKGFTTMLKVKPFTHEEDAFDDLFLKKETFLDVTHMASLLFPQMMLKLFMCIERGD